MDILQLFAASLGLDIPTAMHAIEAYAFGVVLGGPVVIILAAKMNRKDLLLGLMAIFVLGNVLSAMATGWACSRSPASSVAFRKAHSSERAPWSRPTSSGRARVAAPSHW